jgi:hypothetical protein
MFLVQVPVNSLYTKVVGTRAQGVYAAAMFICVAAGRGLGAVYGGAALEWSRDYYTIWALYLAMTLAIILPFYPLMHLYDAVDQPKSKPKPKLEAPGQTGALVDAEARPLLALE